jgi:hypothetical protein
MRYARLLGIWSAIAFIFFAPAACATRSYLMVDYQLPPASDRLKGQQVRIQVKDVRTDPHVFTPSAARPFGVFSNHYNLTVISGTQRTPVGGRDLQGLFLEVFEKRLVQSGAQIVPPNQVGAPLLQISIHSVQIDLKDRKWIATVSYAAELFIDDQSVTREMVSGNAERVRIIGTDNVDETMSDIITEIINRLDLVKILQQGGRL